MGQAISFHFKPEERLRAALRSLEAALAEQREAVAEFRSNLGSLGESVSGLGGSLGVTGTASAPRWRRWRASATKRCGWSARRMAGWGGNIPREDAAHFRGNPGVALHPGRWLRVAAATPRRRRSRSDAVGRAQAPGGEKRPTSRCRVPG
jgi:hypothetical protein